MGKIGHASSPTKGLVIQNFYTSSWYAVYRSTNREVAELSCNMTIAACNNDNIQYRQDQNTTYYYQLKANNWDPSAITTRCYTDCAALMFANIKGAMARLGISENLPLSWTGNIPQLKNHGFTEYTDSSHTQSDAYAQRGDVYLKSGHAMMAVGDGNLNGYSTGSSTSASNTGNIITGGLNIEAVSPYILGIPETEKKFDGDLFKKSQVMGVMLKAGYLYSKSHIKHDSYIATNLKAQSECADSYDLPYALCAEVRAHSVAEAKLECEKLYYVAAACTPRLSLWLHLDMNRSKSVNERILDYYYKECSSWGFKNTIGIYVTEKELEQIDWKKYQEKFYLWKVDHTQSVDNWVSVIPFTSITSSSIGGVTLGSVANTSSSSNHSTTGQEYSAANANQKKIVDACYRTGWPGAGLCATWVSNVYARAGIGYIGGNANDMYRRYCKYSDKSQLKVGMLVAVEKHNNTSAGQRYGHVGIYVGDNKVRESLTSGVSDTNLDRWTNYYGGVSTPKWGFGTSSGTV